MYNSMNQGKVMFSDSWLVNIIIFSDFLWTISWFAGVYFGFKKLHFTIPGLTIGNALAWEIVSLIFLDNLPKVGAFYLNYILWPILSTFNFYFFFKYSKRRSTFFVIVWFLISLIITFILMKNFNSNNIFLFSGSITTFIISTGFLYQILKDQTVIRHHKEVWIPRILAISIQTLIILAIIDIKLPYWIILLRLINLVIEIVYIGVFFNYRKSTESPSCLH